MKYFRSRLKSAVTLLESYQYPEPFHIAAKNYFKLNKKFGSQDRKAISEICYNYLRCGLSLVDLALTQGVVLSAVLLEWEDINDWNTASADLGFSYKIDADNWSVDDTIAYIESQIKKELQFYPSAHLMDEYEHYNLASNIDYRPRNWAKDHTDKEPRNLGVLGCKELALNQTLDATIQVQDLSSQYICHQIQLKEGDKVWDLCCGSGGKSLNVASQSVGELYLSDVRSAIIENAKSRFRAMHYEAHFGIADMTMPCANISFGSHLVEEHFFNVIIADVPCSGSGTWFRTPEHFTKFKYAELEMYASRQKLIVQNSLPFLKKGGTFYYITCSIFKEENTEVRDFILANSELQLVEEICFDGIKQKADGMYMAAFR